MMSKYLKALHLLSAVFPFFLAISLQASPLQEASTFAVLPRDAFSLERLATDKVEARLSRSVLIPDASCIEALMLVNRTPQDLLQKLYEGAFLEDGQQIYPVGVPPAETDFSAIAVPSAAAILKNLSRSKAAELSKVKGSEGASLFLRHLYYEQSAAFQAGGLKALLNTSRRKPAESFEAMLQERSSLKERFAQLLEFAFQGYSSDGGGRLTSYRWKRSVTESGVAGFSLVTLAVEPTSSGHRFLEIEYQATDGPPARMALAELWPVTTANRTQCLAWRADFRLQAILKSGGGVEGMAAELIANKKIKQRLRERLIKIESP